MALGVFVISALALLMTPGPTNTLIGLAGARHGMKTVLRLMPAELMGYLTSIIPLVWVGSDIIAQQPAIAEFTKACAAIWIMSLAVRQWNPVAHGSNHKPITVSHIYLTTLLNPKSFVFAFVMLPALDDEMFLQRIIILGIIITAVALSWGSIGVVVSSFGDKGGKNRIVHRIAALWLGAISVSLAASLAIDNLT